MVTVFNTSLVLLCINVIMLFLRLRFSVIAFILCVLNREFLLMETLGNQESR